ncbi:hypothetical protein, partial [Hoylesella oralis]|uniref:hypothetical protein n=1 Tax=Hoylesella oralis TaxID=28134 RepID=UPI0028EA8493
NSLDGIKKQFLVQETRSTASKNNFWSKKLARRHQKTIFSPRNSLDSIKKQFLVQETRSTASKNNF